MKLSHFKFDENREQNGVWMEAGGGLRLLIARAGNPRYEERVRRLSRPHLRQIRSGSIDTEVAQGIHLRAMASTILLGWENLEDDDGQPIPYSEEKALEVLTQYRELARTVAELSADVEAFRVEAEEDARGNS